MRFSAVSYECVNWYYHCYLFGRCDFLFLLFPINFPFLFDLSSLFFLTSVQLDYYQKGWLSLCLPMYISFSLPVSVSVSPSLSLSLSISLSLSVSLSLSLSPFLPSLKFQLWGRCVWRYSYHSFSPHGFLGRRRHIYYGNHEWHGKSDSSPYFSTFLSFILLSNDFKLSLLKHYEYHYY